MATITLDNRHKAVLNVFFDDLVTGTPGLRRAMLEAALKVKSDHLVGAIQRLPVAQATVLEVRNAVKDQTRQILDLINP